MATTGVYLAEVLRASCPMIDMDEFEANIMERGVWGGPGGKASRQQAYNAYQAAYQAHCAQAYRDLAHRAQAQQALPEYVHEPGPYAFSGTNTRRVAAMQAWSESDGVYFGSQHWSAGDSGHEPDWYDLFPDDEDE